MSVKKKRDAVNDQATESDSSTIPPGVAKSKFGLIFSSTALAIWLVFLCYLAIRLGQ